MLTFAGCQTAPTPEPKRDVAADRKAIDALRDQYTIAFNSSDAAATAASFTDDAIVMEANQASVEGKQAIQAMFEAMFKANAVKISLTPAETQVAGDWAYERGAAAITVTPKAGKPIEQSLRYVVILNRQPDGSWKLYRDMGNSSEPLPGAVGTKK